MKRVAVILMIAILLAGGAVAAIYTPSYAQVYEYPPPPPDPHASPWVGPNTPWVYYNGDWFLNGILYYFYGPRYGWGPYYAYSPGYIVRSQTWYAPRWLAWYRGQPQYWESFQRQYPYWRDHREGQRYSQKFYEEHHRGQGGGWLKGSQGGPAAPSHPQEHKPGPAQVAPPERRQQQMQHEQQPQQDQQQMQHKQQPQQDQQQKQHEQQPQQQKQHEQQPQQDQQQKQHEQQPQQDQQQRQ